MPVVVAAWGAHPYLRCQQPMERPILLTWHLVGLAAQGAGTYSATLDSSRPPASDGHQAFVDYHMQSPKNSTVYFYNLQAEEEELDGDGPDTPQPETSGALPSQHPTSAPQRQLSLIAAAQPAEQVQQPQAAPSSQRPAPAPQRQL